MDEIFQPFEPGGGHPRKPRRFRRVPLRMILPNIVTLLALCSGLTAIRLALEGRMEMAVFAILVAAVLDGIDGRVARLLKGTSRFGAELDSLTDFVNFGVAPALILYIWTLSELRSFGWIAALIFAICAGLRLARFNSALDGPQKPDFTAHFFVGVPAPAGALTVLLPLYVDQAGIEALGVHPLLVAIHAILVGFLMVSTLPTFSGKKIGMRIRRDVVLPVFLGFVITVAILVSFPFQTLALLTLVYIGSLAVAWRYYRMMALEHAQRPQATDDTPPAA
ncbi:MAG: CDP-diacylglycerol--serine O-phosphatidyltransferase [Hyphomicrobiaceae bacterium]|nr:CDP-diacylglycerol--serine O-phosphatidyltransferase [Hyphomicrobiaceae bacterium]